MQSCCFATINLLLFCRSSCRRGRLCLSSLVQPEADGALISTPSTPSLDHCSVLWVFKATTPNKGNGVIHSLARLLLKSEQLQLPGFDDNVLFEFWPTPGDFLDDITTNNKKNPVTLAVFTLKTN